MLGQRRAASFSPTPDEGSFSRLPCDRAGKRYPESSRFVSTLRTSEVGPSARLKREARTSFEVVTSQSEPSVFITNLSLSGNVRPLWTGTALWNGRYSTG